MSRSSRVQPLSRNSIDEADVIPFARQLIPHIDPYYTAYADHLRPLASFSTVPDNLFAFHEPNGDISLRYSDSEEASFDVIGVIVGFHLDPPVGFPKPNFPFFRRWIKITGVDSPSFAEALKAHEILYHLLADKAIGALPPPRFLVGGTLCLRPSACMLTSLEISPNASPVEIPPSYDDTPYEAAIRAGHGKYIFSDENEVLFFNDEVNANGDILRKETSPNAVAVGQLVQLRFQLRLLKQLNGTFTCRDLLKNVCILHEGLSREIAREHAMRSVVRNRKRRRDNKFYLMARNQSQDPSSSGGTSMS